MNYSFDFLKELEDNRNEIEAFIDSSNTAINSERINELTIIINQLLGHYSQLLVRVQDIIPKEEINISINFQKKIEKQLKALETENSQDKIKLLIEIYNSLIKYYKNLITKIYLYIKTDDTISSYNKLVIKANENIVTLNSLNLSKDTADEIISIYNELKNNIDISKINNFINKTSEIIKNYTINDINDKKGTPTERVFSLFAKINDQIIESFFLPKDKLVYASYLLEDKSKYYAIIKEEKENSYIRSKFC